MEKKMKDKIYKKQVGGSHYKSMVIQPSEFINRNNIPFAEGNAIKYLCRHKQKNQKEEITESSGKNSQAVTSGVSQKNSWGIVK
jgi:hypothetical protein